MKRSCNYLPFSAKALFFLLVFGFIICTDCVQADIVLQGNQHIGDDSISGYEPEHPVTNDQIEEHPSHFHLSHSVTITEVEISDLQGLDGDKLLIYIDGSLVGEGNSRVVDITDQNLDGNQIHTIAVRARCFDGNNPEPCDSDSDQDNDIAFSKITLVCDGTTKSINRIQRRHIGDSYDTNQIYRDDSWQNDWYYDLEANSMAWYPDQNSAYGNQRLSIPFSVNESGTITSVTFYRFRDIDNNGTIDYSYPEIFIDNDRIGEIDHDNSTGAITIPNIGKDIDSGEHTIDIEYKCSSYYGASHVCGDWDDVSWDSIIVQFSPEGTPKLFTYYAMEEASWDGTLGEVADSSGNNHNATAYDGAQTNRSAPAIPGVNGTCRYGTFDGNGDYLEDDDAASYLDGLSAITLMAWVKNTDEIGNDRGVFGTDSPNNNDNRLGLRYDEDGATTGHNNLIKASINTNACDDSNDCLQVETESDLQVQYTWQHIAMTWHSGEKIRIYVDGNEVNTTVTSSGTGVHAGTLDGIDFLRIGEGVKDGDPSPYWQGAIDEFRIYPQDLTASRIKSIMNKTHPCDISPIDHFAIIHDGHAVNCQRERVTIQAQAEDNSTITDYTGTISLSTNSSHGDWSIFDADGNLDNSGEGKATYEFVDSDNGTVDFGLRDTYVETVDINISSHTENPDPLLEFERSGFEFTNSTTSSQGEIRVQISGKPSSTPPNSQDLQLMAVNSTNGTDCQAALNGTVDVEMAFECIDPNTCSGRNASINGTSGWEKIPGNDKNDVNNYNTVSLDFGDQNDASASFDLKYPDAGKIKLHAKYELLTANGTSSGNYMRGPSNQFVVRPFGFHIAIPDNPGATNASGDVFTTAGKPFNANMTAVVWESGDDTNNDGSPDGIPDGHNDQNPTNNVGLNNNQNTPNFGQESDPASVELSSYLWKPDSDNDSGLNSTGTTTISSFTEGSGNSTGVQFDEVGIIEINATISGNDYLGIGSSETSKIMGGSGPVGRFIPDRFLVDSNEPDFADSCTDFTYMGQYFEYDTNPKITIEAVNVNNDTTKNYGGQDTDEDYWKLLGNPIPYYNDATKDVNANFTSDDELSDTWNNTRSNYNGTGTLSIKGDRFNFNKTKNEKQTPFYSLVNCTFSSSELTDKDSVCYDPNDNGTCQKFAVDANSSVSGQQPVNGTELRYGKVSLSPAYGSELLELDMPFEVQYRTTSGFIQNKKDNCTQYYTTNMTCSDPDTSDNLECSNVNPTTPYGNDVVQGEGTFTLTKPGANNTGTLNSTLTLDPWLGNDTAPATFGIYKGNEHIIYQQETTWK